MCLHINSKKVGYFIALQHQLAALPPNYLAASLFFTKAKAKKPWFGINEVSEGFIVVEHFVETSRRLVPG
jgi:hypothetical protein